MEGEYNVLCGGASGLFDRTMEMIVYGELLFLENAVIGGVLLYVTAEIYGGFGVQRGAWRFLAGSVMCGLFSLAIFLPPPILFGISLRVPVMMTLEAAFAVVVCAVVFGCDVRGSGGCRESWNKCRRSWKGGIMSGWRRLPWRRSLTFLLVTYFMGGFTMALLLVTDNTGIYTAAGIYTGDMKAGMLALFIAIGVFTAKRIICTVRNRKFYSQHLYEARIVAENRIIDTKAFLDTGNNLRDPVSGRPAAVASDGLWRRMEEMGMIVENRYCIIPYEAVGSSGLLEGLRIDTIELNERTDGKKRGRRIRNAVIVKGGKEAFSSGHASGCELLLSKEMITGDL